MSARPFIRGIFFHSPQDMAAGPMSTYDKSSCSRCSGRTSLMIDLYYWTTPNGHKVSIFLEETGTPYKVIPINIGKGEQFKAEFLAVSPNNRIPALLDHQPPGGGKPISVMESGAMLVYLAEKTGKFLPSQSEPAKRADVLQWLFWQM